MPWGCARRHFDACGAHFRVEALGWARARPGDGSARVAFFGKRRPHHRTGWRAREEAARSEAPELPRRCRPRSCRRTVAPGAAPTGRRRGLAGGLPGEAAVERVRRSGSIVVQAGRLLRAWLDRPCGVVVDGCRAGGKVQSGSGAVLLPTRVVGSPVVRARWRASPAAPDVRGASSPQVQDAKAVGSAAGAGHRLGARWAGGMAVRPAAVAAVRAAAAGSRGGEAPSAEPPPSEARAEGEPTSGAGSAGRHPPEGSLGWWAGPAVGHSSMGEGQERGERGAAAARGSECAANGGPAEAGPSAGPRAFHPSYRVGSRPVFRPSAGAYSDSESRSHLRSGF